MGLQVQRDPQSLGLLPEGKGPRAPPRDQQTVGAGIRLGFELGCAFERERRLGVTRRAGSVARDQQVLSEMQVRLSNPGRQVLPGGEHPLLKLPPTGRSNPARTAPE